jgi:hypothetical protein
VFRTPDLARVPRSSWAAARPTFEEAKRAGFRIVELTIDQVYEFHAARELYSNALQGNIAYSGSETLTWLQTHFEAFLADIAFVRMPIVIRTPDPGGPAASQSAAKEQTRARSTVLDENKLHLVLDIVRTQRIVDISIVLDKLGNEDLRDPLLRSVETHPNLKAHPGPRTIFLQWRMAA